MHRFIKIEDNEDGTCTGTMFLGALTNNEELTALYAMSFDDLANAFGMLEVKDVHHEFMEANPGIVTEIPNSPDNL
jgi:hypothetical protein